MQNSPTLLSSAPLPSASSDAPQTRPLTVVMATLGGDSVAGTIAALNRGTVVPAEILVCIPAEYASRVRALESGNVKVLTTDFRGQVAQRAFGFRHASHPNVMQLDDDLIVAHDCVEQLLDSLERHGPRIAVSPSLVDRVTGASIYRKPVRNRFIETLYYRLVNGTAGHQPGSIQRSCGAVGVDPQSEPRESAFIVVNWLPGGCVMHRRENLVLDNFYPFPGKAYCEDILHSHYLVQRGIRLMVDSRAKCSVETIDDGSLSVKQFVREVAADYRARDHFRRLTGRPRHLLAVFAAARIAFYLAHRGRNSLLRRLG